MAYSESKAGQVTSVLHMMHLLICIKHFTVAKKLQKLPSNWLTRKLLTLKKKKKKPNA